MKGLIIRTIAWILIVVMITALILVAMGLISWQTFWFIALIEAAMAWWGIPKLKEFL